jgi:hypothetical protein
MNETHASGLNVAGAGCVWILGGFLSIGVIGFLCLLFTEHPVVSLLISSLLAFALWSAVGWARQLNAAFVPLGLRGSSYLLLGRQLHGTFAGRQVDVYPSKGLLVVYFATSVKTQFRCETRHGLLRPIAWMWQGRARALDGADLGHLDYSARDEAWARELLGDPIARSAILRLSGAEGPPEARLWGAFLVLRPGAFLLQVARPKLATVTPERARQWLADLLALAEVAESLPPPRNATEASWLERTWRSDRSALFVLAYVVPVIVLIGASVVFILVLAIVYGGLSVKIE